MRDLERSLFSAAMLFTVISLSAPSPVLAYSTWTMNNDINAINELVQTGVLTPNQGMSLTNRAQNVRNGSLVHNNPISDFFNGQSRFNTNMTPLEPKVARKAIKLINKLESDGILSNKQANLLRSQLHMRANGYGNGMNWNSNGMNFNNHGFMHNQGQLGHNQQIWNPNQYNTTYNGQNLPLWSKVRGHLPF